MAGAVAVDALHPRAEAAAAVVGLAFVNVPAADAVAGQARRTGRTREAAGQIDAIGGAGRMRGGRALVDILGAGGRQSIAAPAGLTDAPIAKRIAAGHTAAMSAQLPGARRGTVRFPLAAVHPVPAGRTHARKRAKLIHALAPILAAQIRALQQRTLVHIPLASAALYEAKNGDQLSAFASASAI